MGPIFGKLVKFRNRELVISKSFYYWVLIKISSLNGKPMKLVDLFIYLRSNISSTERDVNIHIGKAWITIERLSTIWKSDLPDKIKLDFFQAVTVSILLYGCTTWILMKWKEKKLWAVLNKTWKQPSPK